VENFEDWEVALWEAGVTGIESLMFTMGSECFNQTNGVYGRTPAKNDSESL